MFLDINQTSSCRVKSLVQSFENHGRNNNMCPPKEFRDENACNKNILPHIKKKIPPKVAPKPKFGDFTTGSLSDSSDFFDTRKTCHEVNTKRCESSIPSFLSDLDIPNVSPKLNESSKSLSSGIFSYNGTASFLDEALACDSPTMKGYDDIEKTCEEPPDRIFSMQRLRKAVSEGSFIELNSLCSSPDPMRQQDKNENKHFYTFEVDNKDQHLQLNDTCKYFIDKAKEFKQIKAELSSKIQGNLECLRNREERVIEECQHTCMELKEIEDKLIHVASIYEVDKFKLHILEIDKIMYLTIGLRYRLSSIESALNNLEWNGVDERDDLERKRDKLLDQLEEANYLRCCINKRTGVLAGTLKH